MSNKTPPTFPVTYQLKKRAWTWTYTLHVPQDLWDRIWELRDCKTDGIEYIQEQTEYGSTESETIVDSILAVGSWPLIPGRAQ